MDKRLVRISWVNDGHQRLTGIVELTDDLIAVALLPLVDGNDGTWEIT